MKPRALILAVACALPLLAGGAARADDVHSYTDKQGVVHLYNVAHGRRRPGSHGGLQMSTLLIEAEVAQAAEFYKIPPELVKAVIQVESNFNQWAVSAKGAIGLMQLMPQTARDMLVDDPYDWVQNIWGGTRYLRILVNRFGDGDLFKVLAAYNAGPQVINPTLGSGAAAVPSIPETQEYVRRVLHAYESYKSPAPAQRADNG